MRTIALAVALCAVSGLRALALLGGQQPAPAAQPPTVVPPEALTVSRAWDLLAMGDVQRAAVQAQAALSEYPRSLAVLSLAVEVEIVRGGAMQGMTQYEAWLGARPVEEPYVVRHIAHAYLREVANAGNAGTLLPAECALAADGDIPAIASLVGKSFGANLKNTEALATLGHEGAVKALVKHVEGGPTAPVKLEIIAALLKSRSSLAVPTLVGLLKDPDEEVRQKAADVLGQLGAREAIANLKPLLGDPAESVQRAAAGALYRLGDLSGADMLTGLLHETARPLLRLAAADALSGGADADWQSVVRSLTQSSQAEVRSGAARLIAPYDPELARATLNQLLNDPNKAVRELAGQTLAKEVAGDLATLRRLMRNGGELARVSAADRLLEITR